MLIGTLLLINPIFAQQEPSTCDQSLLTVKEIFSESTSCVAQNRDRSIGKSFLTTQKNFNQPIKTLQKDNVLDATQMATEASKIHREFKQCLDIICRNIVNFCGGQNTQLAKLSQIGECEARSKLYKHAQKDFLTIALQENASRKVRSFEREMIRFFEKKMHLWFVPSNEKLMNFIKTFVSKVPVLISQPE